MLPPTLTGGGSVPCGGANGAARTSTLTLMRSTTSAPTESVTVASYANTSSPT